MNCNKFFNPKNISNNIYPILNQIDNFTKPFSNNNYNNNNINNINNSNSSNNNVIISPEQQAVATATVICYAANYMNNCQNNLTKFSKNQNINHIGSTESNPTNCSNNNNNYLENQRNSAILDSDKRKSVKFIDYQRRKKQLKNNKIDKPETMFEHRAPTTPALIQQHLNALVLKQQEQQDQQNKILLHNAISRAVSHPQRNNNVVSLVNSLIENISGNKKLDRTQSETLPQQVNTLRYKTELCRPFEETGACKYRDKCQFAHGIEELRNLQRHPKYKTEYCRTFHNIGFCPYGPRCHFVHNLAEARIQQQQIQQEEQRRSIAQQQRNGINNYNRLTAAEATAAVIQQQNSVNMAHFNTTNATTNQHQHQHQQQRQTKTYQNNNLHQLPLSPPLSTSTGSDRGSSNGSISPANSMHNFQFAEQISPSSSSVFGASQFSFNNTRSGSPHNVAMSAITRTTSQPSLPKQQQQQQQQHIQLTSSNSQNNLQKQNSVCDGTCCPPSISILGVNPENHHKNINVNNNNNNNTSDTNATMQPVRLPIFNRLGSAIDSFNELKI